MSEFDVIKIRLVAANTIEAAQLMLGLNRVLVDFRCSIEMAKIAAGVPLDAVLVFGPHPASNPVDVSRLVLEVIEQSGVLDPGVN